MSPKLEIIQRRFVSNTEIKINSEKKKIGGYAILYNTDTQIGNWFIESIAPGACTKTLSESDVRSCINHDPNLLLGRKSAGTLRISEDSRGVEYEVDLPNTDYANNIRESIARGDVSGCSFSFRSIKEQVKHGKDKELDRVTITELKLYEMGPVTFPQYEETTVGLRNQQTGEEEIIDFVRFQYLFTKKLRGIELDTNESAFVESVINRFSKHSEPGIHSEISEPVTHSDAKIEPAVAATLARIAYRKSRNNIIFGGSNG